MAQRSKSFRFRIPMAIKFGDRTRVGSVKAIVNIYDDKIATTDSPSLKKNQMDFTMMLSCLATPEALKKKIEEANEEQVLAELTRIEALKELADIEAQREQEAIVFSLELEDTRRKLKDAIEEIDNSKELEMKLAVTILYANLLQNELKTVKEMERRLQGDGIKTHLTIS
ncbi:hypothetical protein Fmac_017694 [Flemingia macrophylla]|uniref:Uncharacterized protein n=1 Tax=Flemingia macrophylla TaxID=520843 RepID=A0ABD1M2T8_9FABA